ncbi:putative phenol 2-monooxygenase [Ilyonectria robusta]|uniref:putative phenol 2-monooxygenase n=1 Tax=Ilyonectria robusta TaxID=1079257 RepID=UPI001E8EE6DD|nr:putative phenol 2-monooxygenase [Ilyonectria robusta]KAH8656319.1 putative phenol 2-monooxygenase [Ilyonectria robusta]
MAALWMARCGVKARIIDARATKVFRGHADGMQTGTLDIFDSFGIVDDLYKNAAPAMEMTFWAGGKDIPMKRVARFPKWYPELGQYHLIHTSQGNTERALLDGMKAFNGLEVERGVVAAAIDIDESLIHNPQAHAVKLTVQHLTDEELAASSKKDTVPQPGDFNYNPADEPYLKRKVTGKEGSTEVIRAKFVIGTDGSRSWTRKALGFDFLGDDGDESIGGILDCVATSNFPDILIQSVIVKDGRGAGFVPRENGLLRIAAPVANRSEATPEAIIKSLKEILSPYELNVTHVDWCGVFGTRRRVSSSASKHSRVFLAGDALHVHSPRAGIGMNFSIQDAYNLGWKIAHVVKGISPLALLKTYDEERGLTTKQLIAFDKALSEESPLGANFSVNGTRQGLQDNLPFSTTTAIEYEAGLLVAKEGGSVVSKQHLAPGILVGRRLPSQTVEKHANGEPVDFGKCFPSDGRYRIVVFAGNISQPEQLRRVEHLSQVLELPEAFLQRLDGRAVMPRDVFEIFILHSASRDDVEVADLPPFLFKNGDPFSQVFVDNNQSRTWALSEAYSNYGISQNRGCLVLVRPDRHVMYIGELEDVTEMIKLMSSVLV